MIAGRILVPLDGSALAETILPHATLLARRTGRALTLLRVVAPLPLLTPLADLLPAPPLDDEPWETALVDAHAYLTRVAERLTDTGLTVAADVLDGDPATAIVEYAAAQPGAVLIAMATHGRSGVGRWVLGSVAERVLHTAPAPLLLVRPAAAGGPAPAVPPYARILVPLDGSPLAEQALAPAAALAGALAATLVLVAVVPTGDDRAAADLGGAAPALSAGQQQAARHLVGYLSERAGEFQAQGLRVQTQVAYGQPAAALLRESAYLKADLLVMATHGRSGLAQVWLGSVARKVVHGSPRPVLLVRAQAEPVPVGTAGRSRVLQPVVG